MKKEEKPAKKADDKKARPILSAKNIVNKFGKQIVHEGASIEVYEGEIIAIVGGSGSGKSVMLRTMVGLHKPDEGEVIVNGKPINEIKPAEAASLFGVLFQGGALFSSQTVQQNIMTPLREHTKLDDNELELLAQLKLAMVGLPAETGVKFPAELSGGMVKRAALARALAMDAKILFLDEPTAGLDPVSATEFDDLIVELNQSLGVTVIMITHDLDTVFSVCDRVAVLVDKKIIIDTLPNLLKIQHPWIKEYFHGPRARGAKEASEIMDNDKTKTRKS